MTASHHAPTAIAVIVGIVLGGHLGPSVANMAAAALAGYATAAVIRKVVLGHWQWDWGSKR